MATEQHEERREAYGYRRDDVAVVTGAGGGIGRTVVEDMVRSGVRVVANDRLAGVLDRLRGSLAPSGSQGGGIVTVEADVSEREGAAAAVRAAVDAFGPPTILVNVVGGMRGPVRVPFAELDDGQWDFAMRINLRTTFQCMQAALAQMVPNRRGRIVNIASTAWAGSPDRADYAAAKAGVVALSRSVATHVAPHGITVNVVAPGVTLTEAVAPHYEGREPDVPLGRWNEPWEIAAAVRYLCSDAARNVSGHVLTVAGGANPSL